MALDLYSKIKHVCSRAITKPEHTEYIKIFSHPRSGTHFLEAFVGRNFYQGADLSVSSHEWGHWANRETNTKGNPYGKLFGSHVYPSRFLRKIDYPSIYIYRDGRAVATSIWKTRNFLHPSCQQIAFSDFLRSDMDWLGTPSIRWKSSMNIAQHWENHIVGWKKMAENNKSILLVSFKELKENPYQVYQSIYNKFFITEGAMLQESDLDDVKSPVGLLPNKAENNAWKEVFSQEDEAYFFSQLREGKLYLDEA